MNDTQNWMAYWNDAPSLHVKNRRYTNVKSTKLALSYVWAQCHEAVAARCWTRGRP